MKHLSFVNHRLFCHLKEFNFLDDRVFHNKFLVHVTCDNHNDNHLQLHVYEYKSALLQHNIKLGLGCCLGAWT